MINGATSARSTIPKGSDQPSLLEVLVYVGYLAVVLLLVRTGVGAAVTPSVRPAEKTTA